MAGQPYIGLILAAAYWVTPVTPGHGQRENSQLKDRTHTKENGRARKETALQIWMGDS